jgi:hypothetical protein
MDAWTRWVIVAGLLVSGGCGGRDLGLVPVSGRVLLNGRPLPRGSVSFRPLGADAWDQPTGSITDGQYTLYTNRQPGAAPGSYRVVVFATEAATSPDGAAHPGLPASLVPTRYNDAQRSPLTVDVTRQAGPTAYDLELTSP